MIYTDKRGKPIAFMQGNGDMIATAHFFSVVHSSKRFLHVKLNGRGYMGSVLALRGIRIYKVKEWELRRKIRGARQWLAGQRGMSADRVFADEYLTQPPELPRIPKVGVV